MTAEQQKQLNKLVAAYEDYINLIIEEASETVLIAHNHGWRTTRYDAGVNARQRIEDAKQAMTAE